MSSERPVPLLLLAGFLGSGKTTLLNRLLAAPGGARIAVIVNELGALPIDGSLVVGATDEVVELANGCVCCTVRADLARTLHGLFARPGRFDRVVVEGSGVASPGPVLQTLRLDTELDERVASASVATVCHAARIVAQLEAHPEAAEQVAYADLLVLNHADETDDAGLAAAEDALRSIRGGVDVLRSVRADIDPSALLTLAPADDAPLPSGSAAHTSGVGAVELTSDDPLDLHRLKMWLQFLAARRTHELMRAKGILRCRERPEAVVVQGVYQVLEIGPGPGDAPQRSRLVLIGKDLDRAELERGWAAVLG